MRQRNGMLLAVVLAATLAGPASAAPIDLALPRHFSVASGVMLAGHLELPGAHVANATILAAREIRFATGTLTVCPTGAQGRVGSFLTTPAGNDTCPQGETFKDAQVTFGPATNLRLEGRLPVQRMPEAALASFAGDGGGIILSADGLLLGRPADGFVFTPTGQGDQVLVKTDRGTRTFNGTDHAFRHDGTSATVLAGAIAGQWGELRARLTPTGQGMAEAFQPFDLLDVEAAVRGAEQREPRSNVSGLLYEYGRVPAFVSGAVLGRLAGNATMALDGTHLALVRGEAFDLVIRATRLEGTFQPRVVLTGDVVAVGGGGAVGPPWLLAGLVWTAAAVVLAVRRARPSRPLWARATWWVASALAFLVVDFWVLGRPLGTSAIGAATGGDGAASVFALTIFEVAAAGLSWLLFALPVRLAAVRVVPEARKGMTPALDAACAAVWLAGLLIFPSAVFAMAHFVARL